METPPKIDPFSIEYLKTCKGYDPKFIDANKSVSLDEVLSDSHKEHLPTVDGNESGLLNYTNLSVWYNRNRKIPFVSAYNIDGDKNSKKEVDRNKFVFNRDRRFDTAQQLYFPFYDLITVENDNKIEFEIGHMASHNEMSWGEDAEIKAAQTFHFPNSVPQGALLNVGLWSKLESYVIAEGSSTANQKICVFTGPMMKDSDPVYEMDHSFQMPIYFFKLVVYEYDGKLYSTAFVMSHYLTLVKLGVIKDLDQLFEKAKLITYSRPFNDYNHSDVYQVNIDVIEKYTGLNFRWENVEDIVILNGSNKLEKIKNTAGAGRKKHKEESESINFTKESDEQDSDVETEELYNIYLRPF